MTGIKAVLAALIIAGSAAGAHAADKLRVGVLYLDSQGFYGGIRKGIIEGAGDQGVELIDNNSKSNPAAESEFLDNVVGAKVDAIIMSPVSTDASVASIERAVAAGIPVICYNTCLNEADTKRLVKSFVTTDQYNFGKAMGETAGKWAKEQKIAPKIGILNCDRYEACQQRKKGFLDGIKPFVDVTVVADQEAFLIDVATRVATDMLTAHPEINMIWTSTDNGSNGAVLAIQQSGATGKTVVFGSDISQPLVDFVKDGSILKAIVAQSPQDMGRQTIKDAVALAAGKPLASAFTAIPFKVYTTTDAEGLDAWSKAHADGIP